MADNAEGKQQQRPRNKKYMLVRYGRMHHIGLFEHNENEIPKTPTKVVVKTSRGLELGDIVGHLTCYKGGKYKLDGDQIDEYFKISEIDISCKQAGKFIRFATEDDVHENCHFKKAGKEEIDTCKRLAKELKLEMKVVQAEHILGGERLIFYFMAEGRVDFRELVRRLSHEFQTRIEMRQIGARDEAKLLADVESCGQECCCRRFLKYLKPVNMRMAKMQKATLDPAKISGYCGRLKCCLRYEDETYGELKKKLPKRNMIVRTPNGEGKVLDTQILTQLVIVGYENNEREAVSVDDIQVLGTAQQRRKAAEEKASKPKSQEKPSETPAKAPQAEDASDTQDKSEAGAETKEQASNEASSKPQEKRSRSRGRRRNPRPQSSESGEEGKQEGRGEGRGRRRRSGGGRRRGSRNKQGDNKQAESKDRNRGSSQHNNQKPDLKPENKPQPPVKGTENHDA